MQQNGKLDRFNLNATKKLKQMHLNGNFSEKIRAAHQLYKLIEKITSELNPKKKNGI